MLQARHALAELMPAWTQRAYGRSFTTEGLFTVYDYDSAIMRDSLLARWPTYAPEDALPLIARDRRMPIGPYMSVDTQRAWLRQWIDIHRLSGLPIGMLLAMQGYLAPDYPRVRIVTRSGIWYTLEEGAVGRMLELPGYAPLPPAPYELGAAWPKGGPPAPPTERLRASGLYSRHKPTKNNWDWDSISHPGDAGKWHFWSIVYPPTYPFQEGYDTGWTLDDQLESWGFDEPSGTFHTFKTVIREFKPAKARCWAAIFCPTLDDFDPTTLPDAGFPDGHWGNALKLVGGEWVHARRDDCRYLFPEPND